MRPTVSVAMPTRGRVDFVKRAIASVLEQSFQDFELLILDNSPLVEKERIFEMSKLDSRIIFVDRGDIGVTAARKLGAELSRGKHFALLDSDDRWDPARLEKHVEAWRHDRIGLSWDRWAELHDSGSSVFPQPFSEGLIPPPKIAVRLYRANFIHASAGIVPVRFAQTLGFPILEILSSDWTLFMRAAEDYPAYFIGETLSYKEIESPDRVSSSETQDFFWRETRAIRRWALRRRPSIYGGEYLRGRISPIVRRVGLKRVPSHEPSVMQVLSRIRGRVFVDVGANRGQFSIPLAKNFGKVIAIEPNPSLPIRGRNIQVVRCALSDSLGETNLYLDQHPANKNWTLDTIMDRFTYRPGHDTRVNEVIEGKKTIRVPTTTLDAILSEFESVELVKIDVEGAEFRVLRGAKESLSSQKIATFVIEVHDRERKTEMGMLLSSYGYTVRWLDPDHVIAFQKREP